jgi:OOP family OmpA-OmpF porin
VPRRNVHATIAILVITSGVLLSASIHRGTSDDPDLSAPASALDDAWFSITTAQGRLLVGGTSTSAAHEAALLQLAAEHFSDYDIQAQFRPGVIVREHWESATSHLLYTLAALSSAEAEMSQRSISIRGVTSDADTFAARVEILRGELPEEIQLSTDVLVVRSAMSFDELCEKTFSEIVLQPVSFMQSSAEIRQRSLVTLDRITDFAHDCQDITIVITGHTDASGDESWNRQLSRARAQAVADHIVQRGVDPQRLVVNGLGSSVPIADNSTALGRELNRRIEFELR